MRAGADGQGGVVGLGDGGDDGQAQPEPVAAELRWRGSRWNGCSSRVDLVGGDDRAGVGDLDRWRGRRGGDLDVHAAAGMLCRMALSIRLAASRCSSRASPSTGRGPMAGADVTLRAARLRLAGCSTPLAMSGRGRRDSRRSRPRWLRARVSSASMSCSCWSPASSEHPCRCRGGGQGGAGSARAIWSRVRLRASGVRSSWEALATNWRWASNAASSRASSPSMVSPRSLSSSSGPARASRGAGCLRRSAGRRRSSSAAAAAPGRRPASRARRRARS